VEAIHAKEEELWGIERLMGNHDSAYWKGPRAQHLQDRYRQLWAELYGE
jgi:hypothetical protein